MSTTLVVRVTTNHVPVAPSVGNKTAYQNLAYSLVLPQFFDEDADTLTYSVSNLPPGLSFNASTRTISGTPTTAGTWTVAYAAYDGRVTTTASFTMTVNANHAPVAPTIATRNGTRNTPVYWEMPAFTDSDNDALTYTVSGLPTGLSFNASTRVVTGTPSTTGSWTVTYTANDGRGGVVSTTFTYAIAEPVGNQAPVVTQPLADVSFPPDTAFDFYFPTNSFADPEGQTLTYTAKKSDGTSLPSWLTFVGSTLRFYGTTPSIEFGSWTIRVTATDPSGANVYDDFVFSTTFGGGQQQAMSTTFEMGMSEETLSQSATQSSTSSGPVAVQVKEQWFTYDALNRIKVSGGVLVAGVPGQSNASIQVAADKYDSYELGYDAVGHLVATYRSYTYNTQSQVHVDWTSYDARGNRQYEFYRQVVGVSDPGVKSQYFYDADNQLVEVRTYIPNDTVKDGPLDGEGFPLYRVDVSGMLLTGQRMQYDADGRLLRQDTLERGEENWWYHPTWAEGAPAAQYNDLSVLSLKERVDYTLTDGTAAWNDTDPTNNASGYDAAGRLVSYRYSAKQNNSFYTHTFTSTFTGWDSWQESTVAGASTNTDFKPTTNTLTYDGYGRLTQQREHTEYQDNAIDDRIRAYAYNAEGQVQARRDGTWHNSGFVQDTTITSSGAQEKQNYQFVFSAGQQMAELQAGGTVRVAESVDALAQYLSARGAELSPTLTRQMTPTQNNRLSAVTGVAGSGGYTAGGGMVTVLQGETLQGLAQRVYGTSTLWYVLADANGLSDPNATLTAGVQLKAPSASVNVNDANTFKPYNPGEAVGTTTPSLPYIPPPPSSGCSTLAMVVMVVIAIVVTIYTAGAASWAITGFGTATTGATIASAAIGAAAGSIASQAVGSLMGVTSFSWRQVAVDTLVGGVTAGIGQGFKALAKAGAAAGAASRIAKIANVFTNSSGGLTAWGRTAQAVGTYLGGVAANKIVDRDTGFSWGQVAATALGAYAGAKLNPSGKFHIFDEDNWAGSTGNRLSGAFFDGAMSSTARRLMGGGEQDWRSIALQAAGQTAGETLSDWATHVSRRDAPLYEPLEEPVVSQNSSMEFNDGPFGTGPYVSGWGTSSSAASSYFVEASGTAVPAVRASGTRNHYGLNDRARMAIATIERAAIADAEEIKNLPPDVQELERITVTANGGWWNNGTSAEILRNIARYAPSYYGRASTIKWNGDTNRYVAKYGQWANDTHPNGFFAVPIGASREQAMQYYQANTARHDLMNRQFLSVVSSGMVKAPQVRSMTYEEVMAADGKTIRSLPGSLVKAAVNFVADFAQMTNPLGAIHGSVAALSGAPAPDWKPFEMTSAADQIATFYVNAASLAVGGEGMLLDTALMVRGAPRFVANTTRQLSREAVVALDTMTAKAGDLARKVPGMMDELGAKAGNLADRLRSSRLATGVSELGEAANSGKPLMSSADLVGVEPASQKLIDAVSQRRSIAWATEGSDELRMLEYFNAEASVSSDALGRQGMSVILRPSPSKPAVLEEFLHGTQHKLGLPDKFGTEWSEVHVKSFMLRHKSMLGIGAEDANILRTLLKRDIVDLNAAMKRQPDMYFKPIRLPKDL